ncbi:MAG: L,D-transpeptidase family protein [Deltaproteobacteria bacterium]|nr:L,D-transpeptidase family protein [Deltaproteobacteria bacterium]
MSTSSRSCLPTLLALAIAGGCGGPVPPAVDGSTARPRGTVAAIVERAAEPPTKPAAEMASADELGAKTPEGEADKVVEAPVHPELLDSCTEARAIVIYKADRRLELRCGDQVAGRYGVSLGFAPEGHKHHEGDGRTPEGDYYISSKFHSRFHRSLQVAYPNIVDAERGSSEGQISQAQRNAIVSANKTCRTPPQNTALGSYIQVHGGGGGPDVSDWTLGCVALDNDAIEQAFAFQRPGCNADGSPRTLLRILP